MMLYPLLSTGSTQEYRKSSQFACKVIEWDININTNKQDWVIEFRQKDSKSVFFSLRNEIESKSLTFTQKSMIDIL